MIKCSRANGDMNIELEGSMMDIIIDLCEIIAGAYRELPPEKRWLFREAIKHIVTHEKSPIWELKPENVRVTDKIVIDMSEARRQVKKMRTEGEHDGSDA